MSFYVVVVLVNNSISGCCFFLASQLTIVSLDAYSPQKSKNYVHNTDILNVTVHNKCVYYCFGMIIYHFINAQMYYKFLVTYVRTYVLTYIMTQYKSIMLQYRKCDYAHTYVFSFNCV